MYGNSAKNKSVKAIFFPRKKTQPELPNLLYLKILDNKVNKCYAVRKKWT